MQRAAPRRESSLSEVFGAVAKETLRLAGYVQGRAAVQKLHVAMQLHAPSSQAISSGNLAHLEMIRYR